MRSCSKNSLSFITMLAWFLRALLKLSATASSSQGHRVGGCSGGQGVLRLAFLMEPLRRSLGATESLASSEFCTSWNFAESEQLELETDLSSTDTAGASGLWW